MEYLEGLKQLREVRRVTIQDLAEKVRVLGETFVSTEKTLKELIGEFHSAQRGYRVSVWWQFDWTLPREYSSQISLSGPYLSHCHKRGQAVRKKRVPLDQCEPGLVWPDLRNAISEYREVGTRLNVVASELDLKCSLDRKSLPKSQSMAGFVEESRKRVGLMPQTILQLSDVMDELDGVVDEALLDFNAIEGQRRRYGSFLARWEVPSKLPAKSLSGPTGPGVFYVAFNRGKRMSSPIRNLYLRVHQRAPKGETPLTKQMIQKSRLGKFTSEYRTAYKQLLLVRSERDSVIERLKALQKRLK